MEKKEKTIMQFDLLMCVEEPSNMPNYLHFMDRVNQSSSIDIGALTGDCFE